MIGKNVNPVSLVDLIKTLIEYLLPKILNKNIKIGKCNLEILHPIIPNMILIIIKKVIKIIKIYVTSF